MRVMRHRFIGGALLATAALMLGAGSAVAQGGGPGGEGPGSQLPLNTSPTIPFPTGKAGDSGWYSAVEFIMLNQRRTLGDQVLAVRGFIDSSGIISGMPGTFFGSGTKALST